MLMVYLIRYVFISQDRAESVDLSTDTSLLVDISDALSERDKIKFTVHTKVKIRDLTILSKERYFIKNLYCF